MAAGAALAADERVGVVLLAGGSGKRMQASQPKQFLELRGEPVLAHSLRLLLSVDQLERLVLVISQEFAALPFVADALADPRVTRADPGKERQDSVLSGLQQVPPTSTLVAVHDAARPLVTLDAVHRCLADAATHGAAVLAVPMKATVKESADGQFVTRTLERSRLWEVQTPQVIRPDLLREGFEKVRLENLAVTDDVSIVEQMGAPVKLTLGEYTNLKLTTPEDMIVAEQILDSRDKCEGRRRLEEEERRHPIHDAQLSHATSQSPPRTAWQTLRAHLSGVRAVEEHSLSGTRPPREAAASREEDAWWGEWQGRITCWWLALPAPTQSQIGSCLGALGLHLVERLEAILAAQRGAGVRLARWGSAAADPGCEWLEREVETLRLPAFPSPEHVDFSLPPLPGLLPSELYHEGATLSQHRGGTSSRSAPGTSSLPRADLLGVALGLGIGTGASALVLVMAALLAKRRTTGGGGRLKGRALVRGAGTPNANYD